MAKWYNYKMHYLGNDVSILESQLRSHLNTLPGETVIMLLNSDSAWINKGPKLLLKFLAKRQDGSGIISNLNQMGHGMNLVRQFHKGCPIKNAPPPSSKIRAFLALSACFWLALNKTNSLSIQILQEKMS